MTPEEIQSLVIYRDAMMLVLNKPAGMAVHKGNGPKDNLEQYFDHLRFGLPKIPALVHRLDMPTSGCLVLGRHRQALIELGEMFQKQKIEKTYLALVKGEIETPEGTLNYPMRRREPEKSYRWMMTVADDGQEAITHYKVIGTKDGNSWVALSPKTGRTHQLRVHCSHFGHPIIGDDKYGGFPIPSTLMLHAWKISIPLYKNKPPVLVTAPPPEHMQDANPYLSSESETTR